MVLTPTPPPLSDPAILAVNPKFRYGKEELLKLREAPLSQRKPDFLDVNEVSPTIWDPTRWNADRKKAETPTENGPRSGDPLDHRVSFNLIHFEYNLKKATLTYFRDVLATCAATASAKKTTTGASC